MIKEFENSAGNMLYHFRCILQGALPFAQANKDMEAFRRRANLDEDATKYVKEFLDIMQENGMLEMKNLVERHKICVFPLTSSVGD